VGHVAVATILGNRPSVLSIFGNSADGIDVDCTAVQKFGSAVKGGEYLFYGTGGLGREEGEGQGTRKGGGGRRRKRRKEGEGGNESGGKEEEQGRRRKEEQGGRSCSRDPNDAEAQADLRSFTDRK
jgi:hypothetical protein